MTDTLGKLAMELDAALNIGDEQHLRVTIGDVADRLLKLEARALETASSDTATGASGGRQPSVPDASPSELQTGGGWRTIESAPRDGTMLCLLVDYSDGGEHPLDDELIAATIGFNNHDNDGEDQWKFAGWCWSRDQFTEGEGKVVGWAPKPLPAPPVGGDEQKQRLSSVGREERPSPDVRSEPATPSWGAE